MTRRSSEKTMANGNSLDSGSSILVEEITAKTPLTRGTALETVNYRAVKPRGTRPAFSVERQGYCGATCCLLPATETPSLSAGASQSVHE